MMHKDQTYIKREIVFFVFFSLLVFYLAITKWVLQILPPLKIISSPRFVRKGNTKGLVCNLAFNFLNQGSLFLLLVSDRRAWILFIM
jgi:hypothetical protein